MVPPFQPPFWLGQKVKRPLFQTRVGVHCDFLWRVDAGVCLKMEDTHNLWPFSEVKHSDQWIWITLFLDNRTCVTVKQRYGLCTFVLPSL
jgi:hypothetical protein